MHDVAWRGIWIYVRSKDAQKQLARTSLRGHFEASFAKKKINKIHVSVTYQDFSFHKNHIFIVHIFIPVSLTLNHFFQKCFSQIHETYLSFS